VQSLSRSEDISARADALARRFGTRDPFELAEDLGVSVMWRGNFGRLKGMYRVVLRNRYIFLSNSLGEETARIVCAHELGHDQLHRDFAKGNGLLEFMLYNMNSRAEYEANVFAAGLLLPDDEILELICDGCDAEQIACRMHTDVNLVALKVSHLKRRGFALNPLEHRSDFLK
jgi:Zn-dependent peptidase ImmA (M78 family)